MHAHGTVGLWALLAGALLLWPATGRAEEMGSADAGLVYGFGALGAVHSQTTFHAGLGYETPGLQGLRGSFELGYLAPVAGPDYGIGVLSLNAAYHFPRAGKWSPFVTGGYSLAFRSETANLLNLGGGVDYWRNASSGLRLELRDHIWLEDGFGDAHYWGVRVAFVLRLSK